MKAGSHSWVPPGLASLASDGRGAFRTGTLRGAVITAAFLVLALCSSAPAATATLTVSVNDQKGNPIPDATVNLYYPMTLLPNRLRDLFPSEHHGNTNAQGLIVFEKVESGKIILEVARENFVAHREEFVPDPTRRKNVVLNARSDAGEKLEETTTVEVHVVHKDETPVVGAKVTVQLIGTFIKDHVGLTDANGVAMVVTPLHNEFEIIASKPLLGENRKSLRSKDYPKLTKPQVIILERPPGAEVTITVTDDATKDFVGDATVILDGSSFHKGPTDGKGKAFFIVPGTGRYSVRISQEFYEPFEGEFKPSTEAKQSASFALTAKAKKSAEGNNSVEVTVLQADKTGPISGSNLPLANASVTVGRRTAATDSSGIVKISGDFEGNLDVTVKANGYKQQTKSIRFTEGGRFTGARSSVTFLMQPETSDDVVEVTVFAKIKNKSAPLAGASVAVPGENKTTDANGRAKFTGKFEGSVEVAVEKSGYLRQVKNVNASGGKASATFTLEPEPDEDTVSVTVMAADPKGGSATAVTGAIVSANGLTVRTNKDGKATISGQFKDSVEVGVEAKGFVKQTQQVSITKPARTGTANFVLQAEALPLVLVVEVRSPSNKAVPGADVDFYTPSGTLLFEDGAPTNDAGKMTFNSKENTPAQDVSTLRQGIKVKVKCADFAVHESLIHADLLQPAPENNYLVPLTRDWTELEKVLTAFEARVAAWAADLSSISKDTESALVDKVLLARKRAEQLWNEIEKDKGNVKTALAGEEQCRQAKQLEEDIRKCDADANQKATELKRLLDEAAKTASRCSTTADVELIRGNYRAAIKLLGEIGTSNKQAVRLRDTLSKSAVESRAREKMSVEVQKKAAAIAEQADIVKDAARDASAEHERLANLRKTIAARHIALKAEFAVLVVKYEKERGEMPSELDRRFDKLERALDTRNNFDPYGGGPRKIPDAISKADGEMKRYESFAEQAVTIFRSSVCEIDTMDAMVNGLNETLTNASFEIGLSADLPGQADACAAKVAAASLSPSPTPVSDEITVPDFKGYTDPSKMIAVARQAGLEPSLAASNEAPASDGAGVVVRQNPLANAKAKRRDPLTIYLSQKKLTVAASPTPTPVAAIPTSTPVAASPTPTPAATATPSPKAGDEVIVPSIPSGVTVAEAKAILSAAGLGAAFNAQGGKPDSEDLEFKTSGVQNPPGGSKGKRGETVTVSIYQKYDPKTSPTPTSAPPPSATAASGTMPDLMGATLEQAVARLPANTEILSDEIGDKPPTPEQALTIFSQTPAPGTKFDPNNPPIVKVKRYGSAKTTDAASDPFVGQWIGSSIYQPQESGEVTIRKQSNGYGINVNGHESWYPLDSDGAKLWHSHGLTEITYRLVGDTLVGDWRSPNHSGGTKTGQTVFRRK